MSTHPFGRMIRTLFNPANIPAPVTARSIVTELDTPIPETVSIETLLQTVADILGVTPEDLNDSRYDPGNPALLDNGHYWLDSLIEYAKHIHEGVCDRHAKDRVAAYLGDVSSRAVKFNTPIKVRVTVARYDLIPSGFRIITAGGHTPNFLIPSDSAAYNKVVSHWFDSHGGRIANLTLDGETLAVLDID